MSPLNLKDKISRRTTGYLTDITLFLISSLSPPWDAIRTCGDLILVEETHPNSLLFNDIKFD